MNNKRVVRAGGYAKRLMRLGHICVDTAPQRDNPAGSCFVFYKDRWLNQDIDMVMKSKAPDSPTLKERLAALGMTEAQYRQDIFTSCLRDGGFDGA